MGDGVGCDFFERGNICRGDTGCFVGSGCPVAVVAEVIPSSPKTIVVGGPSFGAGGRLVSLDLRVIEERRSSFSGGEIEAVDTGCFVDSGCPTTVAADVISPSPKTMVGGGPCFGAAARLVSLDVWVIEEGWTYFSGGEIEAVDTGCVAGSGFSATVAADVLPSSPKTMVGGGPCFGAAGRLVSLDVWEIEEGRISFSGGEIEAVDTVCVVGSGFPATVIAEVIPSSPKTMVGGGPCFGAASRFVSLDVWVIEEGLSSFWGGEIEAVDTGCVAGSGFPATVVADVIPSSPKTIVGSGPFLAAAGRLVLLDVRVIEEEEDRSSPLSFK